MTDARVGGREIGVVAALFVVASVVLTLPLAQHPTRTLPAELVDTLLTTWILAWDADSLRHGLRGVWDAPIFFPHHNTLAFSENLLGIAVVVAPIYWISGNPVLTYNVAFLFSFALAGTAMFLLARALTHSRAAAAVAGVYYAFGPYRLAAAQLQHIQMLSVGWLPLSLWALHEYLGSLERKWLGLFVAACCLQALSNTYVAYFMVVPIALVMASHALSARDRIVQPLVGLVIAGAVIVAALVPVAVQYSRARAEYRLVRSDHDVEARSPDARAYFVAVSGVWRRWLPLPQPIFGETEKELFPGIVAPFLAAIACTGFARHRGQMARWVGTYALVAVAGVVLSLGPVVRIWGLVLTRHAPYGWLQHVVPGMDSIRVPSRFVVIAIVGLSVLAGFGAHLILLRVRRRFHLIVMLVLLAGVVADGWGVPIPIVRYAPHGRPEDRAASDWLRDAAPGAVLHLPIVTSQYQELNYQYATLFHGHPIVNGYSGWSPPLQELLRQRWSPLYDYPRFPAAVAMLRAIGIRYIVVHPDDYNSTQLSNGELRSMLDALRASGQVLVEKHLPGVFAFELAPARAVAASPPLTPMAPSEFSIEVAHQPERAAFLVDSNPDTRWFGGQDGSSWIALRLKQHRDVARVELQLADRSLMDYPRDLQIDSEDREGRVHTLYRSPPYAEYLAGFLRDPKYPIMQIDLPPNDSVILRIRELAAGRYYWSVHELRLWLRP